MSRKYHDDCLISFCKVDLEFTLLQIQAGQLMERDVVYFDDSFSSLAQRMFDSPLPLYIHW